jgi:hypothetical protein
MHKHCSNVCKLRPCLDKELKNSARMRTIVTAALQRQYSQTELTFWITYVYMYVYQNVWGVKLTTPPTQRGRTHEAVPPLPHTSLCTV